MIFFKIIISLNVNDFLCDLVSGHPVKVFFLLLQSSDRLHQCLILFARDHHSFRVQSEVIFSMMFSNIVIIVFTCDLLVDNMFGALEGDLLLAQTPSQWTHLVNSIVLHSQQDQTYGHFNQIHNVPNSIQDYYPTYL